MVMGWLRGGIVNVMKVLDLGGGGFKLKINVRLHAILPVLVPCKNRRLRQRCASHSDLKKETCIYNFNLHTFI